MEYYIAIKKNWKQQIDEVHGYCVTEARHEECILYNFIYMTLKGFPC